MNGRKNTYKWKEVNYFNERKKRTENENERKLG